MIFEFHGLHHLSHISFIEIELKNIDIQRNLQIKSQYLDIILNEEVNIEGITKLYLTIFIYDAKTWFHQIITLQLSK